MSALHGKHWEPCATTGKTRRRVGSLSSGAVPQGWGQDWIPRLLLRSGIAEGSGCTSSSQKVLQSSQQKAQKFRGDPLPKPHYFNECCSGKIVTGNGISWCRHQEDIFLFFCSLQRGLGLDVSRWRNTSCCPSSFGVSKDDEAAFLTG